MITRKNVFCLFLFLVSLSACSFGPSGSYESFTSTSSFMKYPETAGLAPDGKSLLVVYQPSFNRIQIVQVSRTDKGISEGKTGFFEVPLAGGSKEIRTAPDGTVYVLIKNQDLILFKTSVWSGRPGGSSYSVLAQALPPGSFGPDSTLVVGGDGKLWLVARMPAPSQWIALYQIDPNTLNVIKGPIPLGRRPLAEKNLVSSTKNGDLWIAIGLDNNLGGTKSAVAFVTNTGDVIGRYPVQNRYMATSIHTIEGRGVEFAENSGCFAKATEPRGDYLGSLYYEALMKTLDQGSMNALETVLLHQNPTSPMYLAGMIGSYVINLYSVEEQGKINKMQEVEVKKLIARKGFSKEASHQLYLRIMRDLSSSSYNEDRIGKLNMSESCVSGHGPSHNLVNDIGVVGWLRGGGYWSMTNQFQYRQRNGYAQYRLVRRTPIKKENEGFLEKVEAWTGNEPMETMEVWVRNQGTIQTKIFPVGRNAVWVFSHHFLTYAWLSMDQMSAPPLSPLANL